MNSATFYLQPHSLSNDDLLIFCCHLARQYYVQQTRVFLHARNQAEAQWLDEYLWQQDVSNFVAHALVGETRNGSAQVEIGWQGTRHSGQRQVLINLCDDAPSFAPAFAQVIDFVPSDEALKQTARERYKHYRMAGREMRTQAMDSL